MRLEVIGDVWGDLIGGIFEIWILSEHFSGAFGISVVIILVGFHGGKIVFGGSDGSVVRGVILERGIARELAFSIDLTKFSLDM